MSMMAHHEVRMSSVDELLAVAEGLEREAAARYRALSARMARQGDSAMAAQFEALAGMEERHVQPGRRPGPGAFGPRLRAAPRGLGAAADL